MGGSFMTVGLQWPWIAKVIASIVDAGRVRVLLITGLLIAGVAVVDWRVGVDISLGVLYILPMAVAASVLSRVELVGVAFVCALLRWRFDDPHSVVEASLRFTFALLAYVSSGLFIMALSRNHQLMVVHVRQVEREQALRREAQYQLQVMVESSPAAILTLDGNGIILAANYAARDLFAIEERCPLEGQHIDAYLPVLADALRLDTDAEPFRTAAQCQGHRGNGEIFLAHTWFSTYKSPTGARLAAIVVDSSEEMRDREEQNLQQLMRNNRILAAAVSHEIRNLCGAVAPIYASLNARQPLRRDEDFVSLGNLIKGLERIACLDLHTRGQDTLEAAPLQEILDDLRIVAEPAWLEIGGSIVWDTPRPTAVLGDRHGLLQTFLNLAQNSWRAVQQRDLRQLRISVSIDERSAFVRFHDSGTGIGAPEQLFQPFQPGSDATGIGLYVSRAIVRSYGGELRYEPQPQGACFVVELQRV